MNYSSHRIPQLPKFSPEKISLSTFKWLPRLSIIAYRRKANQGNRMYTRSILFNIIMHYGFLDCRSQPILGKQAMTNHSVHTLSIVLEITIEYSLNQLIFLCYELYRQHSAMISLSLLQPEWIYTKSLAHSSILCAFISLKRVIKSLPYLCNNLQNGQCIMISHKLSLAFI